MREWIFEIMWTFTSGVGLIVSRYSILCLSQIIPQHCSLCVIVRRQCRNRVVGSSFHVTWWQHPSRIHAVGWMCHYQRLMGTSGKWDRC